jgi:hypothetical protein
VEEAWNKRKELKNLKRKELKTPEYSPLKPEPGASRGERLGMKKKNFDGLRTAHRRRMYSGPTWKGELKWRARTRGDKPRSLRGT